MTDPAGTYSSPYALDRLFLIPDNTAPRSSVLSFQSETAVANYFGVRSTEASLANEFFAGYSGAPATMLISRYTGGGRRHLYGVNISNLTLNQLQSISGSLSIAFQGYTYSGSINLSGVTSFTAAAGAIQAALNSSAPVAAVTAGSSIAPVSVSFTGSLNGVFLQVTSVSSGSIELGAQISGPGIAAGAQIVRQEDGTPGGPGLYVLYVSGGTASSETMTESYGVLTVGSVTSGTVANGEHVTGAGVASLTAIEDNLSGSGAGSTWVVNNAQTVAAEDMTMTAAPLSVIYNSVVGATANRDYFTVQPNGDFGFDNDPSSLSYMGGTAAAALGLTQASGALDSTPGGNPTSVAAVMNNLVQNENSQFGSFQATWTQLAQEDPEYLGDMAAWAQSTDGLYQFLSQYTEATSPAGASMPTTDPAGTYSGPGASAPTVDPAGTYSGPGASAPTLADPGTYIPMTGATAAAAEIVDPPGTYSGAGASAPTTDPAGTYSGAEASAPTRDAAGTFSPAGASAPTLAAAGTYIPGAGATSSAAELVDLAGTYSGAGASAPTTDPAGTYSGAGASAPTQDPAGTFSPAGASVPTLADPGTYIPVTGATSAAAEIVDFPGSYSLAGASAPTLAQPGYYVPTAGASSETPDDPGYYTPYAGATAEILALPPVISGTEAGQSTPSGQSDTPFSSVTITDPNIDTSDSLSIQLTGAGGTLADGAGFTGLTASAPGVYLLSGTAAAITSELDALVFTPSAGSGTTTFTLTDTTSVSTSASDANTTVTVESSGPVAVSTATFLADHPTLDKIGGGFAISDTAADVGRTSTR